MTDVFESDQCAILDEDEEEEENEASPEEEEVNVMLETQDPHSMGSNLNDNQALMSFLRGNIGTGMLSMPVVYKNSGLWPGLFMVLASGLLATYNMHVLYRVSESTREKHEIERSKMDYTETVFGVFKYGPRKLRKPKGKIKHTVNVFLLITQIGFCCVYVLFLCQNIKLFIQSFFPESHVNLYLVGFLLCVFLAPFCLVTNMRIFAYLSMVANSASLISLMLIFAYLFYSGLKPWRELPGSTSASAILIAFGIVTFSYEGISLVVPIASKMTNPANFASSAGVLNTGMIVVVLLNAALGFFGYLVFGTETDSSITYNMKERPYWFAPVKPLMVVAILGSYLIQFYVPAAIFGRLMEKLRWHREASDRRRFVHLKLMRLCLVAFTYTVAMIIPHLDLMISLIGTLAGSMLALILPPVLEIVHYWRRRREIHWFWFTVFAKHMLIVIIGLISFLAGTFATILQIIEEFAHPPE